MRGRVPWYIGSGRPILIACGGGSAGGKTTFCKRLRDELNQGRQWDVAQIISTDSFYRKLNAADLKSAFDDQYNFDHPDAFEWDLLLRVLQGVVQGRRVEIPHYDFATHSRLEETTSLYGADILIVEGILALHDKRVRDMCDILVYVHEDADVRLCRRIKRDINERGRSLESVIEQYMRTVKDAGEQFIEPTMKFADIIVPRGRGLRNEVAVQSMVESLQHKLQDRVKAFKASLTSSKTSSTIPVSTCDASSLSSRITSFFGDACPVHVQVSTPGDHAVPQCPHRVTIVEEEECPQLLSMSLPRDCPQAILHATTSSLHAIAMALHALSEHGLHKAMVLLPSKEEDNSPCTGIVAELQLLHVA